MIANWLYLNGVNYEYEREYSFNTASSSHRQYTPDFYYPEVDVWHEHWALDTQGRAPNEFSGYEQEMAWKRTLHQTQGTKLVETTFGQVVFSNGLSTLKSKLMEFGIEFKWDPDRPKAAYTEIEDGELIRLIRSFMSHVKSNSLSKEDIFKRIDGDWSHLKSDRTNLFLSLYWPIHDEWAQRLKLGRYIDFEDMLIQAAVEVESERHVPEFDLILIDEFQDSSSARARLVNSLLRVKGKFVLAVGDDWQSINRFAGADISLMTNFHHLFGEGPTLPLSKTFRSTQVISDVAANFVTKNPEQLKKNVHSDESGIDKPVTLIRTIDPQQGVLETLQHISEEVNSGDLSKASVFILGRYRFNQDWVPSDKFKNLNVTFRTIHSSKGLEADYVVIVNFEAGQHGFPSEIEDDPVLDLAMSKPETFEHAEERRLLYVALTRAKRQAFLVTRQNRDSTFAVELLSNNQLNVVSVDTKGAASQNVLTCPKCKKGVLMPRVGKYGEFLGCSRFPKCAHTSKTVS
jgi:DNA helicase-4